MLGVAVEAEIAQILLLSKAWNPQGPLSHPGLTTAPDTFSAPHSPVGHPILVCQTLQTERDGGGGSVPRLLPSWPSQHGQAGHDRASPAYRLPGSSMNSGNANRRQGMRFNSENRRSAFCQPREFKVVPHH